MKQIDLFFEGMMAAIFAVLTCTSLVFGFTYMEWWQFLIAGGSCAMSWFMTREIHKDFYGHKPKDEDNM